MSVKHTPGPWRASFKTNKTNNLGIYNEAGLLVASVDVHQIAPIDVVLRRKQDARLIAAAPDLLDALQKALDHCIWPASAISAAEAEARAAIAKATGGTQ